MNDTVLDRICRAMGMTVTDCCDADPIEFARGLVRENRRLKEMLKEAAERIGKQGLIITKLAEKQAPPESA